VAIAFVAGALIGFAGGRVYSLFHGPMRRMHGEYIQRRIIEHLDDELRLTPQQHQKVEQIMQHHHRRMQEISEGLRPRMREEIEAANREVDALLTPEQREKFHKMQMRMRFMPPPRDGHPPPPPGF